MMAPPELTDIYTHSDLEKFNENIRVEIDRPALNQISFDEIHERIKPVTTGKDQLLKSYHCSRGCLLRKLLSLVPFLNVLYTYKPKECFLKDLVAGVTVGLVDIPQSMGFALLAGVAPVYGLYSSFFPVIVYFFLGQSRHVAVGTMALTSIMIRNAVDRESEHYMQERGNASASWNETGQMDSTNELELYKASIASALSLVSSLIMLAMGILRLGVVKKFMPTSYISGFTTGAAFHICTSQVPAMLGIQIPTRSGMFKLIYIWIDIFRNISHTNIATLIISLILLALLILFKEFINIKLSKKLPFLIPIEVIILILATGLSYGFSFDSRWGVKVIGAVPRGIPAPEVPPLERAPSFIIDSFIVAILSFVITISMADIFARKYHYAVDTNHELISNALSYGFGCFFHCFMGAAAPPRCFIQESCGGKTKISSVFTFSVLLLVILFIGPLFQSLPKPVLASIIFVAIFPLFKQFKAIVELWRITKIDFSIWIVSWATVTFLDVPIGLGIGIIWSILTMPIAAMTEGGYVLGRTSFQDIFAPMSKYNLITTSGDIVIFRYENALFFPTVEKFKERLYKCTINPAELLNPQSENASNREKIFPRTYSLNNEKSVQDEDQGTELKSTGTSRSLNTSSRSDDPWQMDDTKNDYAEAKNGNVKSESGTDDKENEKEIVAIILDCSAMTYVDHMGLGTLKQLSREYHNVGIKFVLAGCTQALLKKLENGGNIRGKSGDKLNVYPTIQDAIVIVNKLRSKERASANSYL